MSKILVMFIWARPALHYLVNGINNLLFLFDESASFLFLLITCPANTFLIRLPNMFADRGVKFSDVALLLY